MTRYTRQECLPAFGNAGQQALLNAHVVVAGAGGLGCAALPYLVGGGIGKITIVDADTVSLSNLHRQVLYKESDIGQSKARCAKRYLEGLNSEIDIKVHSEMMTPNNAHTLCDDADIVLDCADNFALSYTLSDFCLSKQKSLVSASALGGAGYVGGFCAKSPSLRAVFPDLPSNPQNCSSQGVMGAVVGTVGSIQAQFAVNILLGDTSPLGLLTRLDFDTMQFSSFRFDNAPEPPTSESLAFIAQQQIKPSDWVLDLRKQNALTPATYPSVYDSIRYLSLEELRMHKHKPDNGQRAVIACRTGLTAWRAAQTLQQYWQGDIKLIAMAEQSL